MTSTEEIGFFSGIYRLGRIHRPSGPGRLLDQLLEFLPVCAPSKNGHRTAKPSKCCGASFPWGDRRRPEKSLYRRIIGSVSPLVIFWGYSGMKKKYEEIAAGYLFLTPNLIGFLIFTFLPIFASLLLSFTDYSMIVEISTYPLK